MKKYRVWTEQINQDYYDVLAENPDDALRSIKKRKVHLTPTSVLELNSREQYGRGKREVAAALRGKQPTETVETVSSGKEGGEGK